MIYIVEVPHRMPATAWHRETPELVISAVQQQMSQQRSGDELPETYDQALEWLGHDLRGMAVFADDAEAVAALESGEGIPQHQHLRALAALRRELVKTGALVETDEIEDD